MISKLAVELKKEEKNLCMFWVVTFFYNLNLLFWPGLQIEKERKKKEFIWTRETSPFQISDSLPTLKLIKDCFGVKKEMKLELIGDGCLSNFLWPWQHINIQSVIKKSLHKSQNGTFIVCKRKLQLLLPLISDNSWKDRRNDCIQEIPIFFRLSYLSKLLINHVMLFTFVTCITQTAMSNSELELFVICEVFIIYCGNKEIV